MTPAVKKKFSSVRGALGATIPGATTRTESLSATFKKPDEKKCSTELRGASSEIYVLSKSGWNST